MRCSLFFPLEPTTAESTELLDSLTQLGVIKSSLVAQRAVHDPCRLDRQVKQFGELAFTPAFSTPAGLSQWH